MSWDSRGYYYRSRRMNGQVTREYIGKGEIAEFIAEGDAIERELKFLQRSIWVAEKQEMEGIDAQMRELDGIAMKIIKAAMTAAGYHQHKRGEWRRKRHGNKSQS